MNAKMPAYLSDAGRNYNQIRRLNHKINDPIQKLEYYLSSSNVSSSSGSSLARASNSSQRSDTDGRPSGYNGEARNISAASGVTSARTSAGSYSSRLMNLIRSQWRQRISDDESVGSNYRPGGSPREWLRRAHASDRHHANRKSEATKRATNGENITSPLESSGFSEGPQLGGGGGGGGDGLSSLMGNYEQHHGKSMAPLGRVNLLAVADGRRRVQGEKRSSGNLQAALKQEELLLRQQQELSGRSIGETRQVRMVATANGLPPSGGPARSRRRKITRMNRRNLNRRGGEIGPGSLEGGLYGPGRYTSCAYDLSELFSQSEIPGFREIFASDSYLRKFCWIVAFLFMTVLSLNDMTALITEYYEYPITVDVRLRDSARLPFPAVTVCNLNAVRFSALCSSSRFELASQIPPDLRDKLCGLQVDKGKQKKKPGNQTQNTTGGDSDIGDINNIGITTTTTSTTTTTTSTTTTSTLNTSTTAAPSAVTGANASTPTSVTGTMRPGFSVQTSGHVGSSTMASVVVVGRRTGSGGDRVRVRRSHQLAGAGGERPFASKMWSLKLSTASPGSGTASRPPAVKPGSESPEHRNKASQFNGLKGVNGNVQVVGSGPGGGGTKLAVGPVLPSDARPAGGLGSTNYVGGPGQRNQHSMGGGGGGGQLGSTGPVGPMSPIGAMPLPVGGPGGNRNPQPPPPSLTDFTPFIEPAGEDFELTERQEREVQENLTNWLAVMYQRDPALTRSLGHQFDEMILRCTMKSINCTRQRSFENSFSPTEGNCFTFSSRVKRKLATANGQMTIMWDTYEEANLAGTSDGLELVLNLEKNEYIAGSSQVGALVMIHHPSELGYAASEATFVAPEFTTYIGLKMVNVTRLPAPYPEYCVDSWPTKFADTLTRNSTYSQQACLKICLQKTIQTQCNCQSAFLPIVELDSAQLHQQQQVLKQQEQPPPSSSPPTPQDQQQQQHQQSQQDGGESATGADDQHPLSGVPSQAVDMVGNLSASFVHRGRHRSSKKTNSWLHPLNSSLLVSSLNNSVSATQPGGSGPQQQRIIICDTRKRATRQCVREVNLRAADRMHNCECPPKCQVIRYDKTISMARWPTSADKVSFDRGKLDVNFQNLAKVIVYFQTMTCEEVQQQAVFNAAKLFSALGGIMGMYVGFSFLSVFEIFEVMSRKFWHYLSMRFLTNSFSLTAGAVRLNTRGAVA